MVPNFLSPLIQLFHFLSTPLPPLSSFSAQPKKKMFKTKSTPKTDSDPLITQAQVEDQPPPPYTASAPADAANATKTKTKTDNRMSAQAVKQWESFAKTPQMSLYDPFLLSMNQPPKTTKHSAPAP